MNSFPHNAVVPHAIAIVVNQEKEVLLIERLDDGFFDFPGGGMDIKETVEECVKRELFEETGLTALEVSLYQLLSGDITYYHYQTGNDIWGLDAIFIINKYVGELKPQLEEVKDLKFYKLKDIPEKMSNRNKYLIKKLYEDGLIN